MMVVFDDHLPDRLSLPGRKQIAEDAVFSAFYVQLEKVNRPFNEVGRAFCSELGWRYHSVENGLHSSMVTRALYDR